MHFTTLAFGENAQNSVEEVCNFPYEAKEGIFAVADMLADKFFTAKVTDVVEIIVEVEIFVKRQFFMAVSIFIGRV